MLWAFVLIYALAVAVGVLANVLLNVQLRRPGLPQSIALVGLTILAAVFLSMNNTRMPEWLLALLWAAIGLLAGLGSREARAPS